MAGLLWLQSSLVPAATNPSPIVPLGDSTSFSVVAYNGPDNAYANTELEIQVPAGWEILFANPDLKEGSLSLDKRTARVAFPAPAMSQETINFTLKPLCDINTEIPEVIIYKWYPDDDSTPPIAEATSPEIGNINVPVISFSPPASNNQLLPNIEACRT
ncbi:MAG: hypothetical protein LBG19_11820 [Prevotellaceae bacterium]|nr:hypothetical protein [Prevotellaceae bacterium]